jgi:hypothetical protein
MSEKIYCGNAKTIETKFGKMLKISFSKSDLQALNKAMEGKEWVNCNLKKKQTIVEGKPTHYLEIDTYVKPNENNFDNTLSTKTENKEDDGLPF